MVWDACNETLSPETGKAIARMVLDWEASHSRSYALEVSTDGRHRKEVYRPDGSKGGSERVRFAATEAHWMRLRGIRRATAFGDSLRERRVFRE